MLSVRVINVIDGRTMAVSPPLQVDGRKGSLVRVHGLEVAPLSHPRGELARDMLTLLLLGSHVQIAVVHGLSGDAFVCDVHCNGRSLLAHLPQYASRTPEPVPATDDADNSFVSPNFGDA